MSNFSKDIALTSFSGYMAFSGAVVENAKNLKIPKFFLLKF